MAPQTEQPYTNQEYVDMANRVVNEFETEIYYDFNLRISLVEYAKANPNTEFLQEILDFLTFAKESREGLNIK